MSLIPSANSGNASIDYFIENIGGDGSDPGLPPCIKGTALGAVRVGGAGGMVIRGDPNDGAGYIRGGKQVLGQLFLGASATSFQNIALTDGLTTVNTQMNLNAPGASLVVNDDIAVGGNLIFGDGSLGKSISGYYNASVPVAVGAPITNYPVPNPAGLTQGWYFVAVQQPAGAAFSGQAQPGTVAFYNGTSNTWNIGGAGGGSANFFLFPSDDRTQFVISNSTGAAFAGTVVSFAKVMN